MTLSFKIILGQYTYFHFWVREQLTKKELFSLQDYGTYTNQPGLCVELLFCEWINLGVEIDEDWHSVGNIENDALDDLRGNFLQLFEKDDVPINGWDAIVQEPTEHDKRALWMEGNILLLVKCCSFGICLEISRMKFL
jgi:hypothetical protein